MTTTLADIRAAAYRMRDQLRQLADQHHDDTTGVIIYRTQASLDVMIDNIAELEQWTRSRS